MARAHLCASRPVPDAAQFVAFSHDVGGEPWLFRDSTPSKERSWLRSTGREKGLSGQATLAQVARLVHLQFDLEVGEEHVLAALTLERDGLGLIGREDVRCFDHLGLNAGRAEPPLALAVKRHLGRRMGGVAAETRPVFVRPPHANHEAAEVFEASGRWFRNA